MQFQQSDHESERVVIKAGNVNVHGLFDGHWRPCLSSRISVVLNVRFFNLEATVRSCGRREQDQGS